MSILPTPKNLKAQSTVYELKERLDWGEPALTIIDTRDRKAFNVSRIQGAISLPKEELVARSLANLESTRDIYVYDATNEQTTEAAELLRAAGYQNVAEIIGGLAAWKAVKYPMEGNSAVIA